MKKIAVYLFCYLFGIPLMSAGQIVNNGYYKEKEIRLSLGTGQQLYGTLTIPEVNNKGVVVIIVPGSGPTDRDGNQYGVMYPNAYKFIARELAKSGISSLRYDKSGVGASIWANYDERKLSFDSYVDHLLEWVTLLKTYKETKRIVLLGHSEGALIAMLAANKTYVDSYIGVAGPSLPFDSILLRQIKGTIPFQYGNSVKIIDSIKAGLTVTSIPIELKSVFRPAIQPYLFSLIRYDPSKQIEILKCPILLIQGDNDIQMEIDDAIRLSKANPAATLALIKGMNHVLKNCPRDRQLNMKTYHSPVLPIDSMFTLTVTDFINKTFK